MTNREKYFKNMCAHDFLLLLNNHIKDENCILGLILEDEYDDKETYGNCDGCIKCSECINRWLNEEAKNS